VEAGGCCLPLNRKNELGGVAGRSGISDAAGNDGCLSLMCTTAGLQRQPAVAGVSRGLDGRVALALPRNGFLRRPCLGEPASVVAACCCSRRWRSLFWGRFLTLNAFLLVHLMYPRPLKTSRWIYCLVLWCGRPWLLWIAPRDTSLGVASASQRFVSGLAPRLAELYPGQAARSYGGEGLKKTTSNPQNQPLG